MSNNEHAPQLLQSNPDTHSRVLLYQDCRALLWGSGEAWCSVPKRTWVHLGYMNAHVCKLRPYGICKACSIDHSIQQLLPRAVMTGLRHTHVCPADESTQPQSPARQVDYTVLQCLEMLDNRLVTGRAKGVMRQVHLPRQTCWRCKQPYCARVSCHRRSSHSQ